MTASDIGMISALPISFQPHIQSSLYLDMEHWFINVPFRECQMRCFDGGCEYVMRLDTKFSEGNCADLSEDERTHDLDQPVASIDDRNQRGGLACWRLRDGFPEGHPAI